MCSSDDDGGDVVFSPRALGDDVREGHVA